MPPVCSVNKKGINEAKIPTGKTYFKSEERAENRINDNEDSEIKAERVIKLTKVFKDSEKIKSYDFKKGVNSIIKIIKTIRKSGAKVSFLSTIMLYSS